MKKLYLIRHAKASWDELDLADFDRPLNEQGIHDAQEIAQQLKDKKAKPNLIISSPAKRAIATAEIFAETFKYAIKNILQNPSIYSGSVEDLIAIIENLDEKLNCVFIVGHNPNLTWLAHHLYDGAKMNIPTCGVLGLEFSTAKWPEVMEVETKLLDYLHPHHEIHG